MMNLGVVLPEPGYLEAVREITAAPRHRPDLRRGQDRPVHRRRRRDRALRRHARHGHARQGARRRPADRRDRRHRGGHGGRRGRHRLPGRHLQRQPARHGRGAREPARGPHARGLRAPRRASTTASSPAARASSSKHDLPGYAVGVGSKGCVTFSPTKIVDYETFKANQDAELAELAWLFNMNRGIFMTPGREEEWTLSVTPHREAGRPLRRRLRGDGRRADRLRAAGAGRGRARLVEARAQRVERAAGRLPLGDRAARRSR